MKILTYILLTFIITGVVILFLLEKSVAPINYDFSIKELHNNSAIVEKKLDDFSSQLLSQLIGFCTTVIDNRDFSMKLLVEKDYSAPEVADIAPSYIKAMGLSFLEITNSENTIISSGHFPASAGNKILLKNQMQDSILTCIYDDIKGKKIISLQIKIPFLCMGVKLYCYGGIALNTNFISFLQPKENVVLFLKHQKTIVGYEDIKKISEIKDNKIIINDKSWIGHSLPIHWIGETRAPEFIILLDEPLKFSLMNLL